MDRLAWWQHPRAFFEKYDLLLTPTIACPPFKVGLDNPAEIAGRPVPAYGWIPFTYPFNVTGQPAASSVAPRLRASGARSSQGGSPMKTPLAIVLSLVAVGGVVATNQLSAQTTTTPPAATTTAAA